MRKFLALCVIMSLLFLFTVPALIADVNKIDLGSNLSFTFEPSSTMETPLTLVPFANLDSSLAQGDPIVKIEKNPPILLIFGVSVLLGMFFHKALIS